MPLKKRRPSPLSGPPVSTERKDSLKGVAEKPNSEHRDEIQALLVADLLGPAGGDQEEIPWGLGKPRDRYLTGILAPHGSSVVSEERDVLASAGTDSAEDGPTEGEGAATDHLFPSSIGISFIVDLSCTSLRVSASWGKYEQTDSALESTPTGKPRRIWKRRPKGGHVVVVLTDGHLSMAPDATHAEAKLECLIRKSALGWVVTLFLINRHSASESKSDAVWLFQPQLVVTAEDNSACFVQKADSDVSGFTENEIEEREQLKMLYRDHLEFAVGHGVAVHSDVPDVARGRAQRLTTRIVPWFDVPQVEAPKPEENANLHGVLLDMKELAEQSSSEVLPTLTVLIEAYERWIRDREADVEAGLHGFAKHHGSAEKALSSCRRTLDRLRAGIALLESQPHAMAAFQFANRAMWLQRIKSLVARRVRKSGKLPPEEQAAIDVPKNRTWRPFQLAFVVLNLPSLTDLHHPERSHPTEAVADLLWFPTGGGKTEAYLGLTAYTLALRRLQGVVAGRDSENGLAVIMRYTLRLLTIQQFQRATALLCACESIRRGDQRKWGREPFRIGLWVGRKTTPNSTAQAAESVRRITDTGRAGLGSPAQLTSCPWCGAKIEPTRHIRVLEAPGEIGRTILYCGDDHGRCDFSAALAPREGLPVLVVDEEIYRRPPSVLVATVDKFAQMPWKGETQMLFGRVTGVCPRHGFLSPDVEKKDASRHPASETQPVVRNEPHAWLRPPDLIIQDELHLISGPLGSMVGLYETAVDTLCSWEVDGKLVRPKVVASTATIRRAAQQVKQLFVRRVEVFPPSGVHLGDNFFSKRRPTTELPGRRYLGICSFGRRYPEAVVRVYTTVMAAAQVLYQKVDRAADPWMTLVGYYNSIRELGGARRLVEDDIRSRLRRADQKGLASRRIRLGAVVELTSRQSSEKIPAILDQLETQFCAADEQMREQQRKEGKKPESAYPYDVVLATNMISVGVDVDRLGLMVVAGQPKTTAEYIQATSRVGRQTPGLVITLYNWARPRDLSHYETFEHYHATFYQHVEALSVTAFAPRALDRGLSGVMAALIRLSEARLNANEKAGELTDTDPLLAAALSTLATRAENVTDSQLRRAETEDELMKRRAEWLARGRRRQESRLGYSDDTMPQGPVVGLLKQPGQQQWDTFTCLNSLRDVEPKVHLLLTEAPGLDPLTDAAAPLPAPSQS